MPPSDDDDEGNAAAPGGAPLPPANHHCISATLQGSISSTANMDNRARLACKREACESALREMHGTVFPAWSVASWLLWAVCSLEFGKQRSNPHLQHASMHVSSESPNKVLRRFKKEMRDVLKRHVGANASNPEGVITWALGQVHIHTNPKYLGGYAWKEHVRYANVALFPHAVIGVSYAELQVWYDYFKTVRSSTNEGGAGTLNLLRPGQSVETSTMTRTSVLPDVEYFEHMQGLAPLGLSVGKLVANMVASDHTQLHPMFASGANASAGPDPTLQNVWLLLRKKPRLADGDGVHLVNKLLYADPNYDHCRDREVSEAIGDLKPGPKFVDTNSLTFSECVMAVRSGALPSGAALDTGLDPNLIGRGIVLSITGGEAEATAHECAAMMEARSLKVNRHVANLGLQNVSDLLAAAAARMLSSFEDPHTLSFSDFAMRLTNPSLIDLLHEMLELGAGDVCPALTADDFGTLLSGMAPPGAGADHAWLLKLPRVDVDVVDAVVKYADLGTLLAASLAQYEVGTPRLHIRIVQVSRFGIQPNTPGSYFVCAWQLSLAHMHQIERRSATAQHSSAAGGQGSSSAAGSSSTTLMQLYTSAQASLARH